MTENDRSYQRPRVSTIGSVAELTLLNNKKGTSSDAYSAATGLGGSIIGPATKA